jgi:hypothetical protein
VTRRTSRVDIIAITGCMRPLQPSTAASPTTLDCTGLIRVQLNAAGVFYIVSKRRFNSCNATSRFRRTLHKMSESTADDAIWQADVTHFLPHKEDASKS